MEDILKQIIEKAQMEAKRIDEEAQKKAEEERSSILSLGEERRKKLFDDVERKTERVIKKAKVLAHKEGKNQILIKKHQIIDEILDKIVTALASMPAKDYEQFLSKMLTHVNLEEGILYPSKGKENSTKGAVKIAEKRFLKIGESRNIQGGFIVESKFADLDFSFETMVKKIYKNDLEEIIVRELFKQ